MHRYSDNILSSWITLSNDKIFQRDEFACATYQDRYILLAGGYRNHDDDDDNDDNNEYAFALRSSIKYDMHTHTHESLPDLPFSGRCEGAIIKDHFYVTEHSDVIHRLDLQNNSGVWETFSINEGFQRLEVGAVVSDENHLFMILNKTESVICDEHSNKKNKINGTAIFNSVVRELSLPTLSIKYATAMVQNQIFVMGGYFYNSALSLVHVFNTVTQRWSQVPPLPIALACAAATVVHRRWIVISGAGKGRKRDRCAHIFIFDVLQQKWITLNKNDSKMQKFKSSSNQLSSLPRNNHKCVVVGNNLVSVGGCELLNYFSMDAIPLKDLIPDWGWECAKEYVLLRRLVEKNRAFPLILNEQDDADDNISYLNIKRIIQNLITTVSWDILREVLLFLF